MKISIPNTADCRDIYSGFKFCAKATTSKDLNRQCFKYIQVVSTEHTNDEGKPFTRTYMYGTDSRRLHRHLVTDREAMQRLGITDGLWEVISLNPKELAVVPTPEGLTFPDCEKAIEDTGEFGKWESVAELTIPRTAKNTKDYNDGTVWTIFLLDIYKTGSCASVNYIADYVESVPKYLATKTEVKRNSRVTYSCNYDGSFTKEGQKTYALSFETAGDLCFVMGILTPDDAKRIINEGDSEYETAKAECEARDKAVA